MLSVIIPTYEMDGTGADKLKRALNSLSIQSFTDFEVVVSDQSATDYNNIENLCKYSDFGFPIIYSRYLDKRGYFTANTNNAIKLAKGNIIKLLDSDDWLYDKNSLLKVSEFDKLWCATTYYHYNDKYGLMTAHYPSINNDIHINNTIGTPSCVAVKVTDKLPLMDETLRVAGDSDWYKQLLLTYGEPNLLNDATAIHYLWPGQNTYTIGEYSKSNLLNTEFDYLRKKYEITS